MRKGGRGGSEKGGGEVPNSIIRRYAWLPGCRMTTDGRLIVFLRRGEGGRLPIVL